MAQAPQTGQRPLSPHLQIYRWPLTMAMSIMHRISGCALAVGLLLVTGMLVSAAKGPEAWSAYQGFLQTPLVMFAMFGWSLALFYHMCSGTRHLIMDTGRLFNLKHAKLSSMIVLVVAALLVAGFWFAMSAGKVN
jgi:succinate dehydrogenase / fumarate reductase cytochrome b subunit